MAFELNRNVDVLRDGTGRITQLQHMDAPYRADAAGANLAARATIALPISPRELAERYVEDVLPHLEVAPQMAAGLQSDPTPTLRDAPDELRFCQEKISLGSASVSYCQTRFGVPVWDAGLSVQMETEPLQVTGLQSTLVQDLKVSRPVDTAGYLPAKIDPPTLSRLLGVSDWNKQPTINNHDSPQLFIYRYVPARRLPLQAEKPQAGFNSPLPTLPLPAVAESIQPGYDYVVAEIQFSLRPSDSSDALVINWTSLIEVESGSVLLLQPLVGCLGATGCVYQSDPITRTGSDANFPGASAAILNSFRESVNLQGLTPPSAGQNQGLAGEFVSLVNVSAPNPVAPTSPLPGAFCFDVATDDFSAVCAYHNCDRLFRMVQDFGFNVRNYFDNTVFPVRVDHRATIGGNSNTINAEAPGNAGRNGSDGFRFALARVGSSVGISSDWRIVLHEFGHALLWDNVHWPNFGFAHSAGDALAAILNDPGNRARRELTFPWLATVIPRRHDRTPQQFAWGGVQDGAFTNVDPSGYVAEEILSSTMFRIYRAAGGDSQILAEQQFAANYTVFLIIKAISLLAPATNPRRPEALADFLMQADTGTFIHEGQAFPCGVLRKIVRWGFEQQGAYSANPAGTNTGPGVPPDVDVYIEDRPGGNPPGEYGYVADVTHSPGIWVRQAADGVRLHQAPVSGVTNFVYVEVKNRGSGSTASNVRVRIQSTTSGVASLWPNNFQQVGPPIINMSGTLASGVSRIVGPFPWVPAAGSSLLLAEVAADGDSSLAPRFTVANPIPVLRLLRGDNNLAALEV